MTTIGESLSPAAPRTQMAAQAAALVTVMLWGSAYVAIRAAGETVSPGALALGRALVSCMILSCIAFMHRSPLPARCDLIRIATYGILFQAVYSLTLNEAERHVDAGTAAMLIGIGPLLIMVLAGVFLREGLPPRLIAGCAIAFVGTSIIGIANLDSGFRSSAGIQLLLIAVLAYAAAVVVQKSALVRVSAFQVTWLGCTAATVALLPFAPALVRDVQTALRTSTGASTIGWIVYLGVFPTTIGFVAWSFALHRTSAGRMSSMLYLIPLVTILLGWALLGETPSLVAIAGGALSLLGVYVARHV